MLSLLLLAYAQLSAAEGPTFRPPLSGDDVPHDLFHTENDRSVGIRLTVRPDGRVQSCDIEYSSGIDQFDFYVCKLVKRRAMFTAASTQKGVPSYLVYRETFRWVATGFAKPRPGSNPADLTLDVNQLPAGLKSPFYVGVKFDVDLAGRASACSANRALDHPEPYEQNLVAIACSQILASYRAIPAKDERDRAVPSVQNARVAFVTK